MTDQHNNTDAPNNDSSHDKAQPLIEHLIELRGRVLRVIIAVVVVFLSLFYFANDLYAALSDPLTQLLPEGSSMIATDVTAPFFAPFKLTLVVSIFLVIPLILHQAWSFIAPGLYRHEKRIAVPMLVSSIVLFYMGIAFAYFVVFPLMFGFFTSIGPEHVAVTPDISSFLNLVLKLFFAFGVAFEIPVATVLMLLAGITTPESLKKKRAYVIVGCFVIGMLMTPPDIISQALLAIPMWLLFEFGILMGALMIKKTPQTNEDEAD